MTVSNGNPGGSLIYDVTWIHLCLRQNNADIFMAEKNKGGLISAEILLECSVFLNVFSYSKDWRSILRVLDSQPLPRILSYNTAQLESVPP